jgi:hypothetical protein
MLQKENTQKSHQISTIEKREKLDSRILHVSDARDDATIRLVLWAQMLQTMRCVSEGDLGL